MDDGYLPLSSYLLTSYLLTIYVPTEAELLLRGGSLSALGVQEHYVVDSLSPSLTPIIFCLCVLLPSREREKEGLTTFRYPNLSWTIDHHQVTWYVPGDSSAVYCSAHTREETTITSCLYSSTDTADLQTGDLANQSIPAISCVLTAPPAQSPLWAACYK